MDNKMIMKVLLVFSILLSLIFIGIGVDQYFESKAVLEQESTPVKIAVSTTPLSAPFIIAEKLSLFEKYAVRVNLYPTRGGHQCFKMLMNGDVDLATSSESVVMFNSFLRSDFSVLASFAESDNDLKVLSLESSSISEPHLLKGKSVGMVKSSASEYFIYAYMIITGNHMVDFNHVYMEPKDLGPALLSGEVDAISVWEPFGYQLNKEYGEQIRQFNTKGTHNLSFNLIAKKSLFADNLKQYVNVLAAISEAETFITSYPDETKVMVSDYLKIPMSELEWGWDDYIFRLSLSNVLLSNLQTQARWAIASGAVNKQGMPDFRLLIDSQALDILEHADKAL
ncbi:ABC transporter substrate-binding protein [Shewanella woodyi]|uniref:ABC transporter substrate-binding protein n=1 Tax=Shewanella woodyi TaxID=60961 RepID=UPI000B26655F|nr:ABC transporter substrate-binding protein [Shewanella woodyi]